MRAGVKSLRRVEGDTAQTMPAEGIERLSATLEEWERGNFAAGAEILAPDVHASWFIPGGMVDSHGWEEMGRRLHEVFEQWADYRIEVRRLAEVDDEHVLMEGRQHGVGKSSGIEITDELYVVFRFGGDRVTAMYWHPDCAEALRAAGIGE
jgi:hypothetical protein